MSTRPETIEFLMDQLGRAPIFRTKAMFGEYALYRDEKVIAFICDDELLIKPTPEGRTWLEGFGPVEESEAYPGSKMYYLIGGDRWEDRDWLEELTRVTADALPAPKPKKPRAPKR
ncbi:TfoX/Sxy family protein [Leucobacter iarius]